MAIIGTREMPTSLLIEASRRVDWRFLMPDPILGHVLYVEPVERTLFNSLHLFSDSLTIIEMDRATELEYTPTHFDVVVAGDPSRATLQRMATLPRLGGFLYIEAHGMTSVLRSLEWKGFKQDGLWRPDGYVSALRELGYSEVRTHWHWPDFETCKMMIPLDNRAAMHHALDRSGRSLKARLGAGVGRWLHWSGLLTLTVPCFSLLARRSGS